MVLFWRRRERSKEEGEREEIASDDLEEEEQRSSQSEFSFRIGAAVKEEGLDGRKEEIGNEADLELSRQTPNSPQCLDLMSNEKLDTLVVQELLLVTVIGCTKSVEEPVSSSS